MNIKLSIDEITKYCDETLVTTNPHEIENRFKVLMNYYKCTSIGLARGSTFWRARHLGDQPLFNNISDLNYPPSPLVKVGRINNTHEPVFYLSTRKETALAEINTEAGDSIQIAGFRIVNEKEVKFAVIGMFWLVFKNGGVPLILKDPEHSILKLINNLPYDVSLKLIYIDKFFASILSNKEASKNDYLHTRILSKMLMDKSHADAIAYPSIKDEGAYNLAVKAEVSDKLFENVSCSVLKITKKLQYGIYTSQISHMATDVNSSGDFVWENLQNIEETLTMFHTYFYNQKFKEDNSVNSKYLKLHK